MNTSWELIKLARKHPSLMVKHSLTTTQLAILKAMTNHWNTNLEIANAVGIHRTEANRQLNNLIQKKYIAAKWFEAGKKSGYRYKKLGTED